ncbi:unnamed protein product [Urochloa humidicola]
MNGEVPKPVLVEMNRELPPSPAPRHGTQLPTERQNPPVPTTGGSSQIESTGSGLENRQINPVPDVTGGPTSQRPKTRGTTSPRPARFARWTGRSARHMGGTGQSGASAPKRISFRPFPRFSQSHPLRRRRRLRSSPRPARRERSPPHRARMPRHGHHEPAPPACCCSCSCGCGYNACAGAAAPCYYPAPVPASSAASDHLLHAIAAHLLISSPAPAQPPPQPQPQQQPPPPPPAAQANPYPYSHPYQYQYQYQKQEAKTHAYAAHPLAPPQPNPSGVDHGHLLLHSLLRRVAVLESALPRSFPAPPPARRPPHPNPRPRRAARYQEELEESEAESESESPPSPPPRRPRRPARTGPPPSAAAERAARTIQAHFRRFLARRSRTLRQLKELAVLRSKAATIRGSLSGRRGCADPAAVSEAAMDLLLRLDAIQGGDPMIREGKRAVSRELTRILEFVDKVLVKEHEQVAMGDALDANEYHEGCSAAFVAGRPSVSKKKVSFSGNGQVHAPKEEKENGNEVDEASENSSSADSDEVKPSKRSANGKPGLAAPMPVQMESRKMADERR